MKARSLNVGQLVQILSGLPPDMHIEGAFQPGGAGPVNGEYAGGLYFNTLEVNFDTDNAILTLGYRPDRFDDDDDDPSEGEG